MEEAEAEEEVATITATQLVVAIESPNPPCLTVTKPLS